MIAAVDTLGPPHTERAAGAACSGSQVQPDGLAIERYLLETKTSQMREERCERQVNPRKALNIRKAPPQVLLDPAPAVIESEQEPGTFDQGCYGSRLPE
jgi:hypothetical protein